MSLKIPTTQNGRVITAAAALALCWTIGLNLPHRADDKYLNPKPSPSKLGQSYLSPAEHDHGSASSVPSTQPDEIEEFCSHFHLEPYNSTIKEEDGRTTQGPSRKIYDLLLIDPETSLDALELHLAQMNPFVDFFVLLESPSIKPPAPESAPEPQWWERSLAPGPDSLSVPDEADADFHPVLDQIWTTLLTPYHKKIIRRNLSQSSSDFAPGKDRPAAARNAVYSQVVPFLTGPQKAALRDVLLVSDVEELVRPDTMGVLRHCDIPKRVTIRTRKYWYSFQWFKIDSPQGQDNDKEPRSLDARDGKDRGKDKDKDKDAAKEDSDSFSPEWWTHPQATLYEGPETVFPDDLRKERSKDDYVFGNGGWTCQLCYGMITDILVKAGQQGLIWHDGPRWKGAGRVTDRMRKGIDLFDRTNLSRIESNPDIPSFLHTNPHRFPWMLNRDPHGANFKDFDEAEFAQYFSRKKEVDAEKDTEVASEPGKVWNLASTQAHNDPEFAPADEDTRHPLDKLYDFPPLKLPPAPEISDADKAYLKKIKEKPGSLMTAAEVALLEQLSIGDSNLLPPLVYGED